MLSLSGSREAEANCSAGADACHYSIPPTKLVIAPAEASIDAQAGAAPTCGRTEISTSDPAPPESAAAAPAKTGGSRRATASKHPLLDAEQARRLDLAQAALAHQARDFARQLCLDGLSPPRSFSPIIALSRGCEGRSEKLQGLQRRHAKPRERAIYSELTIGSSPGKAILYSRRLLRARTRMRSCLDDRSRRSRRKMEQAGFRGLSLYGLAYLCCGARKSRDTRSPLFVLGGRGRAHGRAFAPPQKIASRRG